jgi:hypothetical protein
MHMATQERYADMSDLDEYIGFDASATPPSDIAQSRYCQMLAKVDELAADGMSDALPMAGHADRASADAAAVQRDLPLERPSCANERQRLLLTINIRCLLRHRRRYDELARWGSGEHGVVVSAPPPPCVFSCRGLLESARPLSSTVSHG